MHYITHIQKKRFSIYMNVQFKLLQKKLGITKLPVLAASQVGNTQIKCGEPKRLHSTTTVTVTRHSNREESSVP